MDSPRTPTRRILVAYDGSADAELALRWAAEEARATGRGLRVVTVDDANTSPWGAAAVYRGEDVLAGVEERFADLDVELESRVGHVTGELLRASVSDDLLVVGSRGHGRAEDLLIGSVSQHLARHAPCPVVVVRPTHDADARRIVVGVDGSATSAAALEHACRRAERTGETVVALHAWRTHAPSTDVWNSEPRTQEGLTHRQVLLAESVAGMRVDHPDVVIEQEAVPVTPVRCLVDASRGASLLVVGSHGLGFFGGLLLGSVSQAVLQRAECPVAVVR
jgi:nucleotide-binding universal stress UspA family protein